MAAGSLSDISYISGPVYLILILILILRFIVIIIVAVEPCPQLPFLVPVSMLLVPVLSICRGVETVSVDIQIEKSDGIDII